MSKLEKEIEAEILHALNLLPNTLAIKYQNQAAYDPEKRVRLKLHRYQLVGMSDIIVFTTIKENLYPVFLEVKTDKGRQSDEQKAVEKRLTKMRGYYKVVRSVHEALSFLDYARREIENGNK